MCLLITGTSKQIRDTLLKTEGLAEDIYSHNSDGVGAMYATARHHLKTPKVVPSTVKQFIAFIKRLPNDDRPLALHARYKTHGHIDLENCHPYIVLPGRLAMMHNGVLSHGNSADSTKSDTWHYIQDYLHPMLDAYPHIVSNVGWQALVESDIGSSNKFAFMTDHGELVVLNKQAGIEHDGLWFSNTYAWKPSLLIPGYAKPTRYWGGQNTGYGWAGHDRDFDDYDGTRYSNAWWNNRQQNKVVTLGKPAETHTGPQSSVATPLLENLGSPSNEATTYEDAAGYEEDIWQAVNDADADTMADLIAERPNFTLSTLVKGGSFVCSVNPDTDLGGRDAAIVKLLIAKDYGALARMSMVSDASTQKIAEIICWYGDWTDTPSADDADDTAPELPFEVVTAAHAA
ncbi:class II glutamine amidotransferase domain-containing protein [Candidimonas nitroreducens]|uniref:Glutamine amidotransferase type-2 domain-containing protein n=1 Tax=Candidimonas nitroreducens TaxID=683354 RepID=A0A225M1L1_9BURK|nr:class II glutamine amidotransferase [Candidimonas nitroreducens]OWT55245.1 hypothetical protein CEY11_21280 [Candidimonas nitroreducens]